MCGPQARETCAELGDFDSPDRVELSDLFDLSDLSDLLHLFDWVDPADKKDPKLRIHPNLKAETREKNFVTLCQRVPKFFEGIQKVARQWSQYRAAHEEDAAGN